MNKFIITSLIRENRGLIKCGKHLDGTPKYEQHLPYCAGLVLHNRVNYERWFLDGFNSKYFLEQFFGYNNLPVGHIMRQLDFQQLVNTDEFNDLRNYITVLEVKDYRDYVKKEGIIVKKKESRINEGNSRRIVYMYIVIKQLQGSQIK